MPQRRLTKRLAQRDIQCSESASSCDDDEVFDQQHPDGNDGKDQYSYLDDIMAKYDEIKNRRLLKMYLKLSTDNTKKE